MWKRNLAFFALCGCGLAALLLYLRPAPADATIESAGFDAEPFEADSFRSIVEQVDQQFRQDWRKAGIEPAPRADDLAIARRLSLGLTGTIPSLEEIRAFEAQPTRHRIQWWLSHLLADRRSADYLAERLARAYVGVEGGPFLTYRRRRFVSWLSDQLHGNTPYDELVRDLIGNTGLWMNSPEVNFVTVTMGQNDDDGGPDVTKLAARVSRAFLGVRIDCVQCHDDFLGGDWRQQDFHQLAAFFAGCRMTFTGIRDQEKDYQFKYLDADTEVTVPPRVPFEVELLDDEGTPRGQLARWVTHPENKQFSRAAVNRMWALLFGRALVEPIDDIPPSDSGGENPYPPGLEVLADDFAKNGCDLRRLVRLIVATEVFQRDSRGAPDQTITARHEAHWAAFPLVRLRPDQVAGSVVQSSSLKTIGAQSHIIVRLIGWLQRGDFLKRYGDLGEDEFGEQGGTIPQRLVLMNGELVSEKATGGFCTPARIAALVDDDERAVESAYLVVLTRRPSDYERAHFTDRLAEKTGQKRKEAVEDLYWTLINSAEFSWNH